VSTAIATMTTTPLCPPAPRTLADAGLSQDLVLQLLLKHLHFGADFTGQDLARRLGLEFTVIEPVLEVLRFTHLAFRHLMGRRTAVRLMAYASNRTYKEQDSYSTGDRG